MVSIWYPAGDVGRFPFAPWVSPGLAPHVDEFISGILSIPRGSVDWAATETHGHAEAGAPIDLRLGALPVVLYSPGFRASRVLGTVLVEELASHGYAVVTIDHTFEAFAVEFPGGRVEVGVQPPPQSEPLELVKFLMRLIAARVPDTRFVLGWLAALQTGRHSGVEQPPLVEGLRGALGRFEIGMFGHSNGGFAAGETMVHDERIHAGIDMDGSLGYGIELGEVAERGLDKPFMLMGAQREDGTDHNHLTDPSWVEFWRNQRDFKLDLTLRNSGHFSYSDAQAVLSQVAEPLNIPRERVERLIGTIDPARAIAG